MKQNHYFKCSFIVDKTKQQSFKTIIWLSFFQVVINLLKKKESRNTPRIMETIPGGLGPKGSLRDIPFQVSKDKVVL